MAHSALRFAAFVARRWSAGSEGCTATCDSKKPEMATKLLTLKEICQKLCRKPTGNHSVFWETHDSCFLEFVWSLRCLGNNIQNATWDGPDVLQLMPRNSHRGKQATEGPQSLSKDLAATGSRDLLVYGAFRHQIFCYIWLIQYELSKCWGKWLVWKPMNVYVHCLAGYVPFWGPKCQSFLGA